MKSKKRLYLAYGSNLNVEQMEARCPDAKVIGTATLPGYRLLFKGSKTGSYLTIEKMVGREVPVAVWEVSETDEVNLDRYEGFPVFYYKQEIILPVKLSDGRTKRMTAFVYIMHEDRKLGLPSEWYVNTCLAGYDAFGFDPKYIWVAAVESGGAKYGKLFV